VNSTPARLWTVVGVAVLALLLALVLWKQRAGSDLQGNENLSCYKSELKPVMNSSGMVASGHNTVCGDFGGNSAIYIYVHRVGEKEGRQNLTFAYTERTDWELPTVEWTGANELTIRVKHVVQVTKMVASIGPVNIHYEIDQEDYPAHLK
jgi:hypothetical protein